MKTRWIDDWISLRAESPNTRQNYRRLIHLFANFSADRCSKDFYGVVSDWRQAKKYGNMEREQFVEDWEDVVRSFHAHIKEKYASLTVATLLTVVKSFFGFWKIPVEVDLPKRACVTYHNKDLTKDDIKQILAHASPRDRVMWLMLAESGMRASSLINMKYWQIREDFEKRRLPMRLVLPSASLKDHVGDRWTFIGQEGYRELKQYLKRRLPLDDEDYVFASEKKKLVKGEQFSISSLSTKFGKLVKQLGLDKREDGKPRRYRQHGLRKYFRNNMKAAINFREFWMGHSIGSDEHYISRDIEVHRAEYQKNYSSLRIYKTEIPESIKELRTSYERKKDEQDQRIAELEEMIGQMNKRINRAELQRDWGIKYGQEKMEYTMITREIDHYKRIIDDPKAEGKARVNFLLDVAKGIRDELEEKWGFNLPIEKREEILHKSIADRLGYTEEQVEKDFKAFQEWRRKKREKGKT